MACMYNQNRVVAELLKKLSSVEGGVCIQDKVLSVRVLLLRGLARYVTSIIGLSTPTAWVSVLHHIHTPSHTLSSISLTYVECLCVTRALAHHLYRVWGLSLPCIVCMSTLSPGTYIHTYV